MDKKYKQLLSNTFIFALGSFGSKLFLFFLVPLYTSILTTSEYGISELVVNVGKLVLPIASLTIYDAIFPFGLAKDYKKEDVFLNVNIVLIVSSILLLVLTPLWNFYDSIKEWKWYLNCFVISSFVHENNMLYLKVNEKNKEYSVLCIIQSIILVILNLITLLVLEIGIAGYLGSIICSNLLTAFLAFLVGHMNSDLKRARWKPVLFRKMLQYSLPLIISSVLWWAMHSIDKLMIEGIIGSDSLGLYAAASKIPSLVGTITSIFNQAWGLSTIKEVNSDNDSIFYSVVFKRFYVVLFAIAIGIITICKPFMEIYVGNSFADSWIYVPFLIQGAIYSSIAIFINSMFCAIRKSMNIMWSAVVAGVVNILLNYYLIPRIGIQGAAIGTMVAYMILAVVRMVDLRKYIEINYDLKKLIFVTFLTFGQAMIVVCSKESVFSSMLFVILYIVLFKKELFEMICFLKVNLYRTMRRG